MTEGGKRPGRRLGAPAAIALVLALWCVPTTAAAATVEAHEEASGSAVNRVTVGFEAAAGEANEVTITARQGEAGGPLDLEIVDAGAPLEALAGCSGGGAPGSPVHCVVHAPKWTDYELCGRDCALPKPGTEWRLELAVDLGDGANSLDAGALPSLDGPPIDISVSAGPQSDQITTGPGNDRIDPGRGDDVVHAGDGWDTIKSAAVPDGNDVFDLGSPTGGAVDYSQRSGPLRFEAGTGGGAGERDQTSATLIVGGSGDDTFVAGNSYSSFEGRGGADVLLGGGQRDLLYGGAGDDRLSGGEGDDRLVGGSGDDVLEGGPGEDALVEYAENAGFGPEANLDKAEEPGGDDVATGGPGSDWMTLGAGNDVAYGEEGDDRIVTGAGTDRIYGGPGNDTLAGGTDFDEISGGPQDDHVFAGPQIPTQEPTLGFAGGDIPGVGPDAVDCGPDEDIVAIDAADRLSGCERVQLEDAIGTGRPIRDRRHGTALLPVRVGGPGRIVISGPGIARATRGARDNAAGGAVALVPVRARGKARAALRRLGRCRVQVKIRYLRRDGGAFTGRRKLNLLLRRGR